MFATHPGYAFDVAALLRIGTPSTDPLPQPVPGEVILRMPDGVMFQNLRSYPSVEHLLWQRKWFDGDDWSTKTLPAGLYRLRLPVPDSNEKSASEQEAMLAEGESVAPAVLVAVALLCISLQGEPDPLHKGWVRCLEETSDHVRVELAWGNGRLCAYADMVDRRSDCVWTSSVLDPSVLSP